MNEHDPFTRKRQPLCICTCLRYEKERVRPAPCSATQAHKSQPTAVDGWDRKTASVARS